MERPDYKNWVPKGMICGLAAGAALCLASFALFAFGGFLAGAPQAALSVLSLLLALGLLGGTILTLRWYRAFDYDGGRQMSRQIIEGIAAYVDLPEGGVGLDVGCGSGALTIAVAKRNPRARMVGLDRWGREYASFSKALCEDNARIEGVGERTSFVQGDALSLSYPDGSFDAVTSNYVYHNISGADKQACLLETLRVLKKGGVFVIHDIMSPRRYGDMGAFVQKLRDMGYERVELIDTTDGTFMTRREARRLMLSGSTLLVGRK